MPNANNAARFVVIDNMAHCKPELGVVRGISRWVDRAIDHRAVAMTLRPDDLIFEAHMHVLLSKACRKVCLATNDTPSFEILRGPIVTHARNAQKIVKDNNLQSEVSVVTNNLAKLLSVAKHYPEAVTTYGQLWTAERRTDSPTISKTLTSALISLCNWGNGAKRDLVLLWYGRAGELIDSLPDKTAQRLRSAIRRCAHCTNVNAPQWAESDDTDNADDQTDEDDDEGDMLSAHPARHPSAETWQPQRPADFVSWLCMT